MLGSSGKRASESVADCDRVYQQVELVKEALAQQPALRSVNFWATSPLMISEFSHSAACRLLETTSFLMEFMTSPNGSSACSGQYAVPHVVAAHIGPLRHATGP